MADVIIGIDAEWVGSDDSNKVLSYQWFGIDPGTGLTWQGIRYVHEGERITLAEWLTAAILSGRDEGILKQWPKAVTLASHWSLAEISVLKDRKDWERRFRQVQGSYTSIGAPVKLKLYDRSRNKKQVAITLRDSLLLAPQKTGLDTLGELVGLPKVELPDGYRKDRMDLFLTERPEEFEAYALRDAEITARYIQRLVAMCEGYGIELGPTAGSIAVNMLLKRCDLSPLGYEVRTGKRYSKGSYRTSSERVFSNARAETYAEFAAKCFHGGRNECFLFGRFDGVFTDWDLRGAYTTALSAYRSPDFDNLKVTTDPDDFAADSLGFAHVRFRFPEGVRFPALFQRDEDGRGLIFCLKGEGRVTAPEIAVARELGAEIEILDGIVIPWKDEARPFEDFVRWVNEQRRLHPKDTHPFENAFFKLLGNNIYGKVAQGVRKGAAIFNNITGESEKLPPSKITCPYVAAYTTGLVRAALAEILNRLPPDSQVAHAITDGFATTADDDDVQKATVGPVCQVLREARERLTGDGSVLEIKHKVSGLLCIKTRSHATHGEPLPLPDGAISEPILAHVSLKLPQSTKAGKNAELIRLFDTRTEESEHTVSRLPTARELYESGGDLIDYEATSRLSLDYDFKRKPIEPEDHNGLQFQTKPWGSYSEFVRVRGRWDQYRLPLKTPKDLHIFESFAGHKNEGRQAKGQTRKEQAVRHLRRLFASGVGGAPRLRPQETISILKPYGDVTPDQMRQDRRREGKNPERLLSETIEATVTTTDMALDVARQCPDFIADFLEDHRAYDTMRPYIDAGSERLDWGTWRTKFGLVSYPDGLKKGSKL